MFTVYTYIKHNLFLLQIYVKLNFIGLKIQHTQIKTAAKANISVTDVYYTQMAPPSVLQFKKIQVAGKTKSASAPAMLLK